MNLETRLSITSSAIQLALGFSSKNREVEVFLTDFSGNGSIRLVQKDDQNKVRIILFRQCLETIFPTEDIIGNLEVRFSVKNLHRALGWLLLE